MSIRRIGFLVLSFTLTIFSCNNDDDSGTTTVELRDREEQQADDIEAIENYLKTYYYNASDFDDVETPKIKDIVITTNPEGRVRLWDELYDPISNPTGRLRDTTINFVGIDYKYYILTLNKGGGETSPNFSDKVRVIYEGRLLDNTVFETIVTPVDLDLVPLNPDDFIIPGWRKVFPAFNVATSLLENNDGTVSYTNHGAGIMFLPSGLAYFANAPSVDIPAYSPLIFEFELLQSFVNDHDFDGVPSYLEDIDGDTDFFLDPDDPDKEGDDDTDNNRVPDYFDPDDDGDGVLTIDEDWNGDGDPTNDMSPINPTIPRYLDPEVAESREEE